MFPNDTAIDSRACRVCGAPVGAQQSEARGFYCGQVCYGISKRTRVERACQVCTAVFLEKPSTIAKGGGKFCSQDCYRASKAAIPLSDRIWPKVNKSGPIPKHGAEYGNCWMWTGAQNSVGYGHIGWEGRDALTHQAAWCLASGVMPVKGDVIGHICDTPLCLRNDGNEGVYIVRGKTYRRYGHLFLTTDDGNAKDASQKRRTIRIPLQTARTIYRRYHSGGVTQQQLAAEYRIGQISVSRIVRAALHFSFLKDDL